MKKKNLIYAILCSCLICSCSKETEENSIVVPPMEQPENPNNPGNKPSTKDIINIKLNEKTMAIIGTNDWINVINGIDGAYMVYGYDSSRGWVRISKDGINWNDYYNGMTKGNFGRAGFKMLNDTFILYSEDPYYYVSKNMYNWVEKRFYNRQNSNVDVRGAAYGENLYVLLVYDMYALYYTTDFETWKHCNTRDFSGNRNGCIEYFKDRFIVYDESARKVVSVSNITSNSPTVKTISSETMILNKFFKAGDVIIMTDRKDEYHDSTVYYTDDGESIKTISNPQEFNIIDVEYNAESKTYYFLYDNNHICAISDLNEPLSEGTELNVGENIVNSFALAK